MRFLILIFCIVLMNSMNIKTAYDHYSIKILTGNDIQTILPFTQQMCLTYFREYPYLYEGTLQEQQAYFSWFASLKHSAVVAVYYDNQPVGFLTGTSLVDFAEHYTESLALFRKVGLEPAEYYYFGEVIIETEHRGHSLSRQLFGVLEQHARDLGYSKNCLVTESHDIHPCKPTNYWELGNLWMSLGYEKSPASISFTWNTLQPDGSTARQEHVLRYWIKDLAI